MTPERVERDPKIPGLELRHRGGKSSWFLAYRTKEGRRRHPKIGELALMNRSQARERARSILGSIADGEDPGERGQRRTVADLHTAYMEKHAKKKKRARSVDEDERQWQVYILPKLGHQPLASITPDDIEDLHGAMSATPYQANRTAALLRKAFKLAVKWKWLKESPVAVEHFAEHQRRRVPTDQEGRAILYQLDQARERDPFFACLVLALVFTGARIGELRTATHEHVGELGLLVNGKSGERIVYLNAIARSLLKGMPRAAGTNLLFPYQSNVRRKWKALLARAKQTNPHELARIEELRIHDIRRWYASAGISAGLTLEAVGQLLGHSQAQTTKRYAYLVTEAARTASEAVAGAIRRLPG